MKTNQYNEPDVIFLQLHDPTDDGVTWCWEQIHHNDVEYIRKDLYDDLKNQITAYQLTIENMEAEREPIAWLHNDPKRCDVIHREVKNLVDAAFEKYRFESGVQRSPINKTEHYTIPLYKAKDKS